MHQLPPVVVVGKEISKPATFRARQGAPTVSHIPSYRTCRDEDSSRRLGFRLGIHEHDDDDVE